MVPEEKERTLIRLLQGYNSSIVAFSGGVDSSYLAFMANQVMGARARLVTGLSPSVSAMQERLVRDFVARFGVNHVFIHTSEAEDVRYAANPSNRCYFCKSELFSKLEELRLKWDVEVIFDGSNADDAGEYRPGRQAAAEQSVRSPLMEAGLSKQDIRELSRKWGLPTWNLPSMPCLASRLPYGVEVTPTRLSEVEQAEAYIRELGFVEFRVRHHDGLARLEISPREMPKALDISLFESINRKLREIGFHYVTLDLQGFRSGSLNEQLPVLD